LNEQANDFMSRPTTPLIAADIIIEQVHNDKPCIVLIKRKNPPYGWAIPGGFVDVGETVQQAALREAHEETSTRVELRCLLGCYSNPLRDARGHTVSLVYIGSSNDTAVAADDAADLALFSLDELPADLCFDHAVILQDYRKYLATGKVAPLDR
jgi:8-oxo-dGTP diphosphatase